MLMFLTHEMIYFCIFFLFVLFLGELRQSDLASKTNFCDHFASILCGSAYSVGRILGVSEHSLQLGNDTGCHINE